jgi:hypothetical protein
MGWCKRRNFVSSGQSQIGGRPIGLKLEVRGRIPSAIPGGGGIEIRSRGFSRVIGRTQMGQSRKACGTEGSNSVSLQRPVGCELGIANGMARQLWGRFLAPNKEPNKPKRPLDTKSLVQIRIRWHRYWPPRMSSGALPPSAPLSTSAAESAFRLRPAAAIVRQYGEQFRRPRRRQARRTPKPPPLL